MDSEELDCILSSNPITRKCYTNTIYTIDKLPILQSNKFYIINTKKSTDSFTIPGHWIAILYYSNKLVFFDSFGFFPPQPIAEILLSVNKNFPIYFNNVGLQNYRATTCALHCLVLAYTFSLNIDVVDVLYYIYNVNQNNVNKFYYDKIAKNFVRAIFGETRAIQYSDL